MRQTSQSAENVPEHQADSAAVVGFGWANGEAGTVVRWRLLSEVRSRALLGFFGETDPGIHAKMCNLGLDMFLCVFCETRNFANM